MATYLSASGKLKEISEARARAIKEHNELLKNRDGVTPTDTPPATGNEDPQPK